MTEPPPDPAVAAQLARLGLLAGADGTAIADALTEAFGDDSWTELPADALLARLEAARPPAGQRGERRPRYGALASDGVLECAIGVGHDDAAPPGAARERVAQLAEALAARGYTEGSAAAAPLLAKIGRAAAGGATTYFTHPAGARLDPPAGEPRNIPVVVRVIADADGHSGPAAASAFADALRHAALSVYAGHWRFGLGPDFDRGLASTPARLARRATVEAKRTGETFDAVLDRWHAEGRFALDRTPGARVALTADNLLPRDPTARLVHWIARRSGDDPTALAPTTKRHRVWMLASCRSAASFPALRASLPQDRVRLVGLRGMSSLRNWRTLPWVLDAIRAGAPWRELTGALNACGDPRGVVVDGWERDPWIP